MAKQDPKFTENIRKAEEKIRADEDGQIDFEEFRLLNREFPLMLQPAFDLQVGPHVEMKPPPPRARLACAWGAGGAKRVPGGAQRRSSKASS